MWICFIFFCGNYHRWNIPVRNGKEVCYHWQNMFSILPGITGKSKKGKKEGHLTMCITQCSVVYLSRVNFLPKCNVCIFSSWSKNPCEMETYQKWKSVQVSLASVISRFCFILFYWEMGINERFLISSYTPTNVMDGHCSKV